MKNKTTVWQLSYLNNQLSEIGLKGPYGNLGPVGRKEKRLITDFIGSIGDAKPIILDSHCVSKNGSDVGIFYISHIGS